MDGVTRYTATRLRYAEGEMVASPIDPFPVVQAHDFDAALAREAALREELARKVVLTVRDVCELEPADSDDPECICVKASDLGAILSRHFEGVE